MTTKVKTAILTVFLASAALAQESQTPTPSAMPEEPPSLSPTPIESLTPTPASEQTPPPSPARSIRISFVPPPLEGRITLGIYDSKGKLLRVLHHEADLNEFTIGADELVTQCDGKDENGEDLSAGIYHAREYIVVSISVNA